MKFRRFLASVVAGLLFTLASPGQAQAQTPGDDGTARIELRRTVRTREYRGKTVEGQERTIRAGDNLWAILIHERKLSEKNFGRYVALMGSLNPQVKSLDALRVGDTLFIPLRPNEILGIQLSQESGKANIYRVQPGDQLFKILREQLGASGAEASAVFGEVRELNPNKQNWDRLAVGEPIRLPTRPGAEKPATDAPSQATGGSGEEQPMVSGGADFDLVEKLGEVLGHKTAHTGEEVFQLEGGNISIDRSLFPVLYHEALGRKVLLDKKGILTPALKARLESEVAGLSVFAPKAGTPLRETVGEFLARLGFQTLPTGRPITIRDMGVGLDVKGDWMVMAPDDGAAAQEIWIINVKDGDETPDYLKDYLSSKGVKWKETPASSSVPAPAPVHRRNGFLQTLPTEKAALVDGVLKNWGMTVSTDHEISLLLREGIRWNIRFDRWVEFGNRKTGVLFRGAHDELKRALQEKGEITLVDLDLRLSSKEVLSRLLAGLGESAVYREHRFPMAKGARKDKLVLTVYGFFLPARSIILTDRKIPDELQRFFAEQEIAINYFQ